MVTSIQKVYSIFRSYLMVGSAKVMTRVLQMLQGSEK